MITNNEGAWLGYATKYKGRVGMIIASASLIVLCATALENGLWNDRYRCWKGMLTREDGDW